MGFSLGNTCHMKRTDSWLIRFRDDHRQLSGLDGIEDHTPPRQNDLPHKARFYDKGTIFLGLVTEFFPRLPYLGPRSRAVLKRC